MLKLIRVCCSIIICAAWVLSVIGLLGGLTEFFIVGQSDILVRSLYIFAFAVLSTIIFKVIESPPAD